MRCACYINTVQCIVLHILMKEIFDLKMKKGDGGEISERRIQVSGYDACEMLEAFWHIWVFGY